MDSETIRRSDYTFPANRRMFSALKLWISSEIMDFRTALVLGLIVFCYATYISTRRKSVDIPIDRL